LYYRRRKMAYRSEKYLRIKTGKSPAKRPLGGGVLGVDCKVLLKWILWKKLCERWTRLRWFTIESNCWLL